MNNTANHTGALPLGADDRRFWVVDHDGSVREVSYYMELYGNLNDPLFVSSVARFLVERDVSGFDAGMRPPDTKAKTALVALAQSESEATLGELVQRWPVDLIAWSDLRRILQDCDSSYAALRHALGRAGMQKVRKVRIKGSPESIYSLRNHASWAGCSAQQLQAEVGRVGYDDKETALFGE